MSEDSQALIREIDEEVRREKLLKLWNKYGTYIVSAAAVLVLLVGGWQWYTTYQRDRAQKAGGQYQEAVTKLGDDKTKTEGLAGLEQIVKQGTPAYATMARLRLAAEQREAGKTDAALALYKAVNDDTSADRMFRSFASLQIASLKVDNGSWTEVQNRLNDLADESSPWRYTARELLGLAAFRHKRWADAKQAFTALLSDPAVPQDLKTRAQTALALITREDSGSDAKKPAQKSAVEPDLKKDKSAGDAAKSTAGASASKPSPAKPSTVSPPTGSPNGAGATNDADKKK